MFRHPGLFAVLGALALTACATPRKADVSLPAGYEAPAAPAGAIALDTWWTAYDDPELTSLVEQALLRNPDVRTARSRLDEVKAQRTSAILQYLPQGDANASGRRTDTEQIGGSAASIPGFNTSGVAKQYSATFNVSWELDPWGRALFAYRSANAEVDRVRYAFETTRAQIAADTADAWFQARGLAIQIADARETIRIQQDLYRIASARGERGLAATSEADRVAGDLAQAQAQAAGLEAQLQVQKRAILILAGRVVEPTANINAPPEVGQAPAVPAALPSDLLERRPDVRGAQAAVRSAAGQQRLAQLAFFPTFTFSPGLGWSRIEQPGFSTETQNWSIGGSIMQPVLSIPRLLSEMKVQNARTEQAVTAYEKTVQTAFQEAEGALVNLDADRKRVALLTDGEARARRAFNASRIGYERGLTDLNSTLSAEQSWRAIRTQLTSAQVQALRRSVQAYKAVGGGWPVQAYAAK
ncbi:MAG: TolC family protein [Alphaproteobacteria bacterium]|nr:TolC family protein [Alphaproteobacteria bacterium]MBU1514625.1 TolC family protein [Alphaproteobacteria bacterium]MBU2096743.1 TolC family protein [Alphaproteobacteria bacterium]MBU2150375.1 TolC family protein [Alphaproteobacteria bacterium]MBU2306624.1 TolC family protein [Alphaproteobacteria bacterium]